VLRLLNHVVIGLYHHRIEDSSEALSMQINSATFFNVMSYRFILNGFAELARDNEILM
jgi:hypothetical protein